LVHWTRPLPTRARGYAYAHTFALRHCVHCLHTPHYAFTRFTFGLRYDLPARLYTLPFRNIPAPRRSTCPVGATVEFPAFFLFIGRSLKNVGSKLRTAHCYIGLPAVYWFVTVPVCLTLPVFRFPHCISTYPIHTHTHHIWCTFIHTPRYIYHTNLDTVAALHIVTGTRTTTPTILVLCCIILRFIVPLWID